jgi:predicted CXXCH cytochrome family protein
MKKLVISLAAAALLGFAGPAVAAEDVANTEHNLATKTADTTEVCLFCHTPHTDPAVIAGAPLWNRPAPDTTTYQMYSSATIDMTIAGVPQGVSLACLSCHDGSIAFDVLIHGPAGFDTAGLDQGWTFTGNDSLAGAGYPVEFVGGDLRGSHPISVTYDTTADPAFQPIATVTATLPLYGAGSDQVECATCHNPHEKDLSDFLRISNAGSAICTTCHIK